MSKHMGLQTRSKAARRLGWCAAAVMIGAPLAANAFSLQDFTIGAGARADFTNTHSDNTDKNANDFNLDSVRLYIGGAVNDKIKFTFNTEYTGSPPNGDNKLQVMDAIARYEYSPEFNIWAGRFLPPSDRANLYGPYYANNWAVYIDGVQDGYANTAVGRDNGAAYWGDFGGLKVSAGLFDVPSTTSPSKDASKVIVATRVQYDFWDKESGYWLNSTYYGGKNLLAVGAALQTAGGDTSYSLDFLLEKNVAGVGTFTVESEYARYKGLTGGGRSALGVPNKSKGAYGLVSYLFPTAMGPGKLQLLGKFAIADTVVPGANPEQKTAEFDLGYIVKEFNARGYLFYVNESFDDSAAPDTGFFGIGLQVQI